eukprot:COSAG02_NODE_100_length_36897_cov_9.681749_35_plen_69_part_00
MCSSRLVRLLGTTLDIMERHLILKPNGVMARRTLLRAIVLLLTATSQHTVAAVVAFQIKPHSGRNGCL